MLKPLAAVAFNGRTPGGSFPGLAKEATIEI
jgi:hypothetical protein